MSNENEIKVGIGYFGEREEQAVLDYLYGPPENKNRVFQILTPAFQKMIPSIIKRYVKDILQYYEEDEIVNDTLSFLITKLDRFDPGTGKKAYSFYGTICRNYLKSKLIKDSKQKNRNISYEDISSDLEEDEKYVYEIETEEKLEIFSFIPIISNKIKDELENNKTLKENDKKVGKAIVQILDNWEMMINNDDKSNIWAKNKMLYIIREMTFLNSKEVRNSLKKFKVMYNILKYETYVDDD